jgi:hypothetical protein
VRAVLSRNKARDDRDMVIFNSIKYIQDQDINGMTPTQLLKLIQELSDSALPRMSESYYLDRLQAVSILVDKALWRLDHD